MVVEFKKEKINDIATAQVFAWKEVFKGILSDELLSNLAIKNFEENWEKILGQKERRNFIWLSKDEKGLGFISYGKPKNNREIADFEIYGIYVHPRYWGKGIGFNLMTYTLESIRKIKPSAKTILWTMSENKVSRNFYTKYGFKENGKNRISERHNESFEEIQFEIKEKNAI